jgi:hypothetical protein
MLDSWQGRGRLSTVDLLVLTSLDQLIFKLKILFAFVTKQATLMRRSTVLSLPLQIVFPAPGLTRRDKTVQNSLAYLGHS